MKKLCLILFCLTLIVSLSACQDNSKGQNNQSEFASAETMGNPCSKEGVDEFINFIGLLEGKELLLGQDFSSDHCYNITPLDIEKLGCKIFKLSNSCLTLLQYEDKVYQLGEFFGGYGLINAIAYDVDDNGQDDIIYTYSWGSGLHRSIVAWFNMTTKTSTVIFDSSEELNNDIPADIDLIVVKSTPNVIIDSSSPVGLNIYSVKIDVQNDNFTKLKYAVTNQIGSISTKNGDATFVRI